MNNMIRTTKSQRELRDGEYKARYPRLQDIPSDVLKYRVERGISNCLRMVSAMASVQNTSRAADHREQILAMLAATNYSASQCAKVLRERGVKA